MTDDTKISTVRTMEGTDDDLGAILTDVYACTRVWEAWSAGTMGPDDFIPAAECDVAQDLLVWRDAAVAKVACHAVDPDVARVVDERDALRAEQAGAIEALSDALLADPGPSLSTLAVVACAMIRERSAMNAEIDALRAELAAAKAHATQQWKAGLAAAAAKVKDSARAWKDTDPNLSDALTRAALGILSLTPPEPTP